MLISNWRGAFRSCCTAEPRDRCPSPCPQEVPWRFSARQIFFHARRHRDGVVAHLLFGGELFYFQAINSSRCGIMARGVETAAGTSVAALAFDTYLCLISLCKLEICGNSWWITCRFHRYTYPRGNCVYGRVHSTMHATGCSIAMSITGVPS